MIGFAVIDNADPRDVAIWLVSRTSADEASNTNAVVVDLLGDSEAGATLRNLVADRAIVLTTGSSAELLPVTQPVLSTADVAGMLEEADLQHTAITAALREYALRPDPRTGKRPKKPRPLVLPDPPTHPREDAFRPRSAGAPFRALATANYLRSVWSVWLEVESGRVHRARNAAGELWMMPETLADPTIAVFPPSFATKAHLAVMENPC